MNLINVSLQPAQLYSSVGRTVFLLGDCGLIHSTTSTPENIGIPTKLVFECSEINFVCARDDGLQRYLSMIAFVHLVS